MGCPCSQRAGATAFVFVHPDGSETERRTEVEARAAQIRAARQAGAEVPGLYGEIKPVVAAK